MSGMVGTRITGSSLGRSHFFAKLGKMKKDSSKKAKRQAPPDPKAVQAISEAEDETLTELRQAIRELPFAELSKLRQTGLKGEPLHKALRFKTEQAMTQWLMSEGGREDESNRKRTPASSSEDYSSSSDDERQTSKLKSKTTTSKSKTRARLDDESDDDNESEEEEEETRPPHVRQNVKRKADDPWLVADEEEGRSSTRRPSKPVSPPSSDDDKDEDTSSQSDDDSDGAEGGDSSKKSRRKKRKAPAERPSNIQVSRNREVVAIPKFRYKGLDPRFSHQEVDINLHRKRYEFLEETRDQEIEQLRTDIRREQMAREIKGRRGRRLRRMTDEELEQRRKDLTRLEQHKADSRRAKMYQEKLGEIKKRNKELVEKGVADKPRIISQKDKKRLKMDVRFEELEKRHKLDRFMDKKRKEQETKVRREDSKGPKLGV